MYSTQLHVVKLLLHIYYSFKNLQIPQIEFESFESWTGDLRGRVFSGMWTIGIHTGRLYYLKKMDLEKCQNVSGASRQPYHAL